MLYRVHLKNIPDFCRSHFSFSNLTEVKKFMSMVPSEILSGIYTGVSVDSKEQKFPKVKSQPATASIYTVDYVSPNAYWYDRISFAIGDGVDLEEAINFMVCEGSTYHGAGGIVSWRKVEPGEVVPWFSHKRNRETGEHGEAIHCWDKKTVAIGHGYFKKEMHKQLKKLRDEEGFTLFHWESWNESYVKNIGGGKFEIITGSSYHKKLSENIKEVGDFRTAVLHIAKDDFLDLLDLDGDIEQYENPDYHYGYGA